MVLKDDLFPYELFFLNHRVGRYVFDAKKYESKEVTIISLNLREAG